MFTRVGRNIVQSQANFAPNDARDHRAMLRGAVGLSGRRRAVSLEATGSYGRRVSPRLAWQAA